MHIPDGFLSPPVAVACGLAAMAAIGYSLSRLRREHGERLVPLLGVTAAGIFAAQMVNFPLVGLQTSGHLMGGVLAAVVLGPWGAVVALTAVLIVQCFLFGDGGVTALGANILNMGVIGGMLGYAVYDAIRRAIGGPRGTVIAATLASWIMIPISAAAFAVQMSLGGVADFLPLLTLMLFYHVWIGLGEALLTGLVVQWLISVRPDLVYEPSRATTRIARAGQVVAAGLALSTAIAVFLAPWASGFEDGLEKVAGRLGFVDRGTFVGWAPFPDYDLRFASSAEAAEPVDHREFAVAPPEHAAATEPAAAESAAPDAGSAWASALRSAGLVTSVLGVIGTVVTCFVAATIAASLRLAAPRASATT